LRCETQNTSLFVTIWKQPCDTPGKTLVSARWRRPDEPSLIEAPLPAKPPNQELSAQVSALFTVPADGNVCQSTKSMANDGITK